MLRHEGHALFPDTFLSLKKAHVRAGDCQRDRTEERPAPKPGHYLPCTEMPEKQWHGQRKKTRQDNFIYPFTNGKAGIPECKAAVLKDIQGYYLLIKNYSSTNNDSYNNIIASNIKI